MRTVFSFTFLFKTHPPAQNKKREKLKKKIFKRSNWDGTSRLDGKVLTV